MMFPVGKPGAPPAEYVPNEAAANTTVNTIATPSPCFSGSK